MSDGIKQNGVYQMTSGFCIPIPHGTEDQIKEMIEKGLIREGDYFILDEDYEEIVGDTDISDIADGTLTGGVRQNADDIEMITDIVDGDFFNSWLKATDQDGYFNRLILSSGSNMRPKVERIAGPVEELEDLAMMSDIRELSDTKLDSKAFQQSKLNGNKTDALLVDTTNYYGKENEPHTYHRSATSNLPTEVNYGIWTVEFYNNAYFMVTIHDCNTGFTYTNSFQNNAWTGWRRTVNESDVDNKIASAASAINSSGYAEFNVSYANAISAMSSNWDGIYAVITRGNDSTKTRVYAYYASNHALATDTRIQLKLVYFN